jgi:hypothetical protein
MNQQFRHRHLLAPLGLLGLAAFFGVCSFVSLVFEFPIADYTALKFTLRDERRLLSDLGSLYTFLVQWLLFYYGAIQL